MTALAQQTYRLLLLLAIQAFLMSRIVLFKFGMSFVYIFFIMFLPLQWPKWVQYIVAFSSGLLADILSGTYGLHAISATVIIASRDLIIRTILPSYNQEEWEKINLFDRSLPEFTIYALILSFIYCLVYFTVDYFSIKAIPRWGLHVVLSTLFTFVSLFIYRYIFSFAKRNID